MTILDVRMRIGLRIKELRHEKGLSQEQLAFNIEMSRTYFAEIEVGRRNVSAINLERITHGLGVTLREFFDSDYFDGVYDETIDGRRFPHRRTPEEQEQRERERAERTAGSEKQ